MIRLKPAAKRGRKKAAHRRKRKILCERLEHRRVLASFAVAEVQVDETDGTAAITITASSVTSPVSVDWATSDGTAASSGDYTANSGTANFDMMTNEVVVNVTLSNDALKESGETFYVDLSNPSAGTITDGTAVVTIADDDNDVGLTRALDRFTGGGTVEHSGGATFTYPTTSGVGLSYSSLTYADTILDIRTVQPEDSTAPSEIEAELIVEGTSVRTIHYDTTGLSAGDDLRFAFEFDGSSLGSGTHDWTLELTETIGSHESFRTLTGQVDVYDRSSSAIGEGWEISENDQLEVSTDWVTILFGNGSVTHYFRDDIQETSGGGGGPGGGGGTGGGGPGGGGGSSSTSEGLIEHSDGTFTYTSQSKNEVKFDSSGKITSRVDLNNNTTEYTYTSGNLTKIERQDGREITFAYTSGLLASVTDWAGRVTTITHNGSDQVTKITAPDPDGAGSIAAAETEFTYASGSGLMKTIDDALNNTTTFNYDAFDRVSSIVYPGPATYSVSPQIVHGLVASSGGTSGSPASLPDSDPRGSTTDPVSITTYGKYSPLGGLLEYEDGLGNVTTWERDKGDYVTKLTLPDPDGAGSLTAPVTEYEYDDDKNLTKVTLPDLTTLTWVYDTTVNRPTKFTDAEGNVTNYTLDSSGNVIEIEQVLGSQDDAFNGETDDIVTSFTYTANPTAVRQMIGGLLLTVTDPRGYITDFDYGTSPSGTSFSQVTNVTYALGTSDEADVQYTYDSDYLLATTVNELGNTTSYDYDDLGRLTQITYPDPDGAAPAGPLSAPTESYTYNAMNQVTAFTDALGNDTTYTYDSRNRLTSTTLPDPDGAGSQTASVSSVGYDAAGRVTSMTDALGNVTSYAYNSANRRTSVTLPDPDGAGSLTSPVTSYAYDAIGRMTSVTDPLSRVTSFEYDVMSRQTKMTLSDPDGAGSATAPEWTYAYTDNGRIESTTDPLSNVTSYTYDDAGRLINETFADPDGAGSQTAPEIDYEFDTAGNLVAVTGALGAVTSYTYDSRNRRTAATLPDPDGAGSLTAPTFAWAYDDANRMTSSTNELGSVTTYNYDNLGRLEGRTLPDPDGAGPQQASFSSFVYNAAGWLASTTDPLSNATDFTYDNLGRITETELPDPDGAGSLGRPTTTFTYDKMGRRLSLTDPESNVTSWAYDNLGRMTSETDPLSEVESYTYDAASRLTAMTDRRSLVIEYNYDDLDRLTSEVWKDGSTTVRTLSFAYDAVGNLTSASDPSAAYTYSYDNLYRATQSEVDFGTGVNEFRLSAAFDTAGRRTSLGLEVDSGSGWSDDLINYYTYDDLGRLSQITQAGQTGGATVQAKRVDFAYTVDGRFDSIERYKALAGGSANEVATTDYTRDDLGRITTLAHTNGATTIADYDFTYDKHNRITQIAASSSVGLSGTTEFSYDTTDQLTDADHTHITDELYSYDENGNRTNSGYTTGIGNLLTSDGTFNYTYDDNGNRLTRTRISTSPADDKTTEYEWDHRNRLISITEKNNSGVITNEIDYEYDVYDRRVSKSIDADGAGSGTAEVTRFVYDGSDILAVTDSGGDITHRMLHGPSVDQILAIEEDSTSEVLWSLTDHLGSVRDLVDSNGNVENHIVYDSYGNVVSETDLAVDFLFGFTGRERDEESGLNYHRARYYDSNTGGWISNDPIGFFAGDTNISRYVSNSPINFTDSSGLFIDRTDPPPETDNERMWQSNDEPETVWGFYVWLYTGEWEVTQDVYDAATGAASESLINNPGLDALSYGAEVDPTPIFPTVDAIINGAVEGQSNEEIITNVVIGVLPGPNLPGRPKGPVVGVGGGGGGLPNLPGGGGGGVIGVGHYRGGKHRSTSKPANDGLDSHHTPSDQASPLDRPEGPAIQMDPEDHRLTASYGGGPGSPQQDYRDQQAELIAGGDFDGAFWMDVEDLQDKFGDKYDEAIWEAIDAIPPQY